MKTLQFNARHNVINTHFAPEIGRSMQARVLNDGEGRFKTGESIITSPVKSIAGDVEKQGFLTVQTRNTTYVVIPDTICGKGTLAVEIFTTEEEINQRQQENRKAVEQALEERRKLLLGK